MNTLIKKNNTDKKNKKISFCIHIKNRFHQIKKTLPKNLKDNKQDSDIVEFVLVDHGSKDGLREWVISNFKEELDTGYLNYYYTEEMDGFHMAISKNTAHLLATGEILTNLDADNYTGKRGGRYVVEVFEKNPNIVFHQYSGINTDGSCGRISVNREDFYKVGGYNEKLLPVGYDDFDLLERLKLGCRLEIYYKPKNIIYFILSKINIIFYCCNKLGFSIISNRKYNKTIKNKKYESMINLKTKISWNEMERRNRELSKKLILNKGCIANNKIFGIKKNIFKYKDGKLISI